MHPTRAQNFNAYYFLGDLGSTVFIFGTSKLKAQVFQIRCKATSKTEEILIFAAKAKTSPSGRLIRHTLFSPML